MFEHKAIKSWGQVFLKNENIKQKIANYVNNSTTKTVLEIGPGLGALTKYIDFENKNYFAVEIDKKLSFFLNENYPKANIINKNFLDFEVDWIETKEEILLFGNIPYYISTPILLKFLQINNFSCCYLMVQKEYFDMLISAEKTKKYSSFSVLIQSFCEIKKICDVGRQNFYPKPKIDSVVLFLKKIKVDLDFVNFAKFLRYCFSMPRKTLYNNLKKHMNEEEIKQLFNLSNFSLNIRAEELKPLEMQEFFKLWYKKFQS